MIKIVVIYFSVDDQKRELSKLIDAMGIASSKVINSNYSLFLDRLLLVDFKVHCYCGLILLT